MLSGTLIADLEADYPGLRASMIGQTILSFALLAFQVFAAVTFFQKKHFVPTLMVVYLLLNLGLTVITVLWTASIFDEFDPSDTKEIIRAVVLRVEARLMAKAGLLI